MMRIVLVIEDGEPKITSWWLENRHFGDDKIISQGRIANRWPSVGGDEEAEEEKGEEGGGLGGTS